MKELAPLIGGWKVEAFGGEGRVVHEWGLGGAFLIVRSHAPDPAPDSLSVIAADGEGYRQHYFDSRGVVRLYRMTFDGRLWTLERREPDFSELPFHQRFVGEVTRDAIDGRWERSGDGVAWELDFELPYTRV